MIKLALALLVIASIAFATGVDIVKVSHDSMATTYCDGDLLLGTSAGAVAELRGKIVLIRHPTYGTMIKRVIGEAGDSVGVESGIAVVNGKRLTEPYVQCPAGSGNAAGRWVRRLPADPVAVAVPAGQLYVLGDNRGVSWDSRDFGPIDRNMIASVVRSQVFRRRTVCGCDSSVNSSEDSSAPRVSLTGVPNLIAAWVSRDAGQPTMQTWIRKHRELENEAPDRVWSKEVVDGVREYLATPPSTDLKLLSIVCKTTRCELMAATSITPDAVSEAQRLLHVMNRQPWWVGNLEEQESFMSQVQGRTLFWMYLIRAH